MDFFKRDMDEGEVLKRISVKGHLRKIESEIMMWLADNGYAGGVIVLDDFIIVPDEEISPEDVLKFNEDFNCDLAFKKITLDNLKAKPLAHEDDFPINRYSFSHPLLESIKKHVRKWLDCHDIDGFFFITLCGIGLMPGRDLKDSEIRDFEDKFHVRYEKTDELPFCAGIFNFNFVG